jgi:UDP-glucuronate 4-epimerase
MKDKILITGVAGFIGFHLTKLLLKKKNQILGVDNINKYYSIKLKKMRISKLISEKLIFRKVDIRNIKKLERIFKNFRPNIVINLAAQAGVKYSIKNPRTYLSNNINGFLNILDLSKKYKVKHLIYASSSSVYGNNKDDILKINSNTDKPISFYALTKKTNEMMAYYYSSMYKLPTTALRLFTVYGPWGRPDMSLFKFVKLILNNKKINLYNYGRHKRSFTFVEDAVEQIFRLIKKNPMNINKNNSVPWAVYNIAGNKSIKLISYLGLIEKQLKIKARVNYVTLQKGDVPVTHGDISRTIKITGHKPKTNIEIGIKFFINWYKKFYNKL